MATRSVRAAFERAISILSVRPDLAKRPNSSATAVFTGGLSCQVTGPGGERVTTDMPTTIGGEGSAPSPGWYLSAAIASCAASGIAARALLQDIELESIEVTVNSQTDTRGMLGIGAVTAAMTDLKMSVVLSSQNATPTQLEALVQWVEAHSPVSSTLRAGLAPTVEIQLAAPGTRENLASQEAPPSS